MKDEDLKRLIVQNEVCVWLDIIFLLFGQNSVMPLKSLIRDIMSYLLDSMSYFAYWRKFWLWTLSLNEGVFLTKKIKFFSNKEQLGTDVCFFNYLMGLLLKVSSFCLNLHARCSLTSWTRISKLKGSLNFCHLVV